MHSLQVGLFAPPENISAAVMLDTLYFYTLAHQSDFGKSEGREEKLGSLSSLC